MFNKIKDFCKKHKTGIVCGTVIITTVAITTACIICSRKDTQIFPGPGPQGYNKKLCNNIQTTILPEGKGWGQTSIEIATNTKIGYLTVDTFQTDGLSKAIEMVNKWMEDNKLNLVEYVTVYAMEAK